VTRSLKKNPFVANNLLKKINKLNTNGRTTGIEPAHGGFTIHCLDPLGYIRPSTIYLSSIIYIFTST
jgi:hypothetical protein